MAWHTAAMSAETQGRAEKQRRAGCAGSGEHMRLPSNSSLVLYTTATLAVGVAFALRLALQPILLHHSPFLISTLAVVYAAWRGGLGPGLYAMVTSALLAWVFIVHPTTFEGSLPAGDVANLLLYLVVGVASSAMGQAMRTARQHALASAAEAACHLETARQNEGRLADILGSAMDAIISVGDDQRIVLFNASAERMFGVTTSEAIGSPVDRFIPERFRATHAGHIQRFGKTGATSRAMGHLGTLYALRADGAEFPIEATISHTRSGDQTLFTVFIRDVTDRTHAEESLRRHTEELQQANRAKDEFLAMLGHELRNPLAPILNALELMRMRPDDVVVTGRAYDILQRQARHMSRLVDDLLDISRITQGKIELRRERLDLGAAVTQAVQVVRPVMEQRFHRLHVLTPSEPALIDADPDRIEQVLVNVLGNAAKYTPNGGQVDVDCSVRDREVVVTVRDTGIGISAELVPRIFDLFTQADRGLDRSLGGLGIGLTLVKRLIELHSGSVEAFSGGLGHGCEIEIRLPLAARSDEIVRTVSAPTRAHPTSGLRILVVDDNADAAEMLADVLATLGHQARTVNDGPSALESVLEFEPDVVLLDIGLPGMDGYEVARAMRRGGQTELRLIAVTGYGQDEDRRLSHEAGFDAHLTKPVDIRLLEQHLAAPTGSPA